MQTITGIDLGNIRLRILRVTPLHSKTNPESLVTIAMVTHINNSIWSDHYLGFFAICSMTTGS
jgi:hypothetical protein